ncbi:MAG: hypothetical protein IPK31_07225 [Chitinophagaceae bacterium]|nr:hypothetical protein [Chitinophagaceae bacterium]
MTNRNPEEMIGRHIWAEFPEGIGQLFHEAYFTAKDEQLHVSAQEYYVQYDRWFELDLYPSTDGMSLFQDITQKKKKESRPLKKVKRNTAHW